MAVGVGGLAFLITSASDVASVQRSLAHMALPWVAVAVGMETMSFFWLSIHLRVLAGAPANAARAAPIRLALVVFGLGPVLPAAPAEGLVLAGSALKRRRMDRRRIAVLLGFSQWFSVRGLLCLTSVSLLLALATADIPTPYRAGVAASAGTTIAAVFASTWLLSRRQFAEWVALVAGRLRHPRSCPSALLRRQRGAAWHTLAMHVTRRRIDRFVLLATAIAAWICDGLCLHFALIALGAHVSIDVLLMAYTVGVLASNIPLLPAGFGAVETVTPAILHHYGVPLATAVAAVLVYRFLGTFLPAAAGALAVVSLKVEGSAAIGQTDPEHLASAPKFGPAPDLTGSLPSSNPGVRRTLT